jgi:hypothetical protein
MLEPERYVEEARRVLPATTVGHEGLTTSLQFVDEEPPD